MKVCVKCGNRLGKKDRFCGKCGSSMYNEISSRAKYCLYCGTALEPRAKFCTKCGKLCEGDISLSFIEERNNEELPELDFLKSPEQLAREKALIEEQEAADRANLEALHAEENAKKAAAEAKKAADEAKKAQERAEKEMAKAAKEQAKAEKEREKAAREMEKAQIAIKKREEEERERIEKERKKAEEAEKKRVLEEARKAEEARIAEEERLRKEEEERLRKEEEERLRKEEEERLRKEEEERLKKEEEERLKREEEERLRKEEEERLRKEEEERLRKEEEERLRREEEERLRKEEEERRRKEEEERKKEERRRIEEEKRLAEEKRIAELKALYEDTTSASKKALAKYEKSPEAARSLLEAVLDKFNTLYKNADSNIDLSETRADYYKIEEILGTTYYKEKAYKLAIPLLKDAAENGSSKSRIYLTQWLLRNRSELPENRDFLLDYVTDAIEGDVTEEEVTIGNRVLAKMYRDGIGVKKNLTTAFEYFKKAADMGDITSVATVGQCYMYGEGVKKSGKEAFEWNMRAAEAGDEGGMRNLAVCYDLGTGVPRDAMKAIEWYKKLLERMENDRFAMYRISLCLTNPDMEYSHKPTDEMYKEAYDYAQRALDAGEKNADYVIGYLYMMGKGVARDYNKAFTHFMQAANYGNSRAKDKTALFVKKANGTYSLK